MKSITVKVTSKFLMDLQMIRVAMMKAGYDRTTVTQVKPRKVGVCRCGATHNCLARYCSWCGKRIGGAK